MILCHFNPGDFRIGTTVYAEKPVQFDIIPLFTPEHFQKVATKDPFKRKQLREGLQQLSEEGVVHVLKSPMELEMNITRNGGVLQFEVVEHRMREEYNVELVKTPVAYHCARWLPNDRADIVSNLSRLIPPMSLRIWRKIRLYFLTPCTPSNKQRKRSEPSTYLSLSKDNPKTIKTHVFNQRSRSSRFL